MITIYNKVLIHKKNLAGVLFLCMTNSSFSAMFAVVNVRFGLLKF